MRRFILFAAAVGGVLAATCAPGRGDPPPTARQVIEGVTHQAIVILRDASLARPDKNRQISALADQNMNFEIMGRLALGHAWRDLTDQQCKDFVVEFRKHISATYGHLTDDYTDEDVIVTGDRAEERGDWTVMTRIVGKKSGGDNEDETKVNYRMRQKDNQWKIIDVTIEDVSMVANFRAQFVEILNSGGFDRLMKLLRDKNAAAGQ